MSPRVASFIVLIVIIVIIGTLFYQVMANFILPLFLAALLVVIFRPLHQRILARCKGRLRTAAGLTTASISLIVLLPAIWVFSLATIEGISLLNSDVSTLRDGITRLRGGLGLEMPAATDLRQIESSLQTWLANAQRGSIADAAVLAALSARIDHLQQTLDESAQTYPSLDPMREALRTAADSTNSMLEYEASLQIALAQFRSFKSSLLGGPIRATIMDLVNPTDEELREMSHQLFAIGQRWFFSSIGATAAATGKLILGVVIMVVAVYFFLVDGPSMVKTVMHLSPLDDRHEEELLQEFARVSRAVVIATLLSAIVQGLLAGLGYWMAGLGSVFLLTLLTAVLAMVPFAGAAAVWIPASLWLYFHDGRLLAAVLLAAYGAGVVSLSDNVVKPWILHGQSRLHPLLALLSVLGGVQVLGPIGILVGPMVVAFLQTLLNILRRELLALETQPDQAQA